MNCRHQDLRLKCKIIIKAIKLCDFGCLIQAKLALFKVEAQIRYQVPNFALTNFMHFL